MFSKRLGRIRCVRHALVDSFMCTIAGTQVDERSYLNGPRVLHLHLPRSQTICSADIHVAFSRVALQLIISVGFISHVVMHPKHPRIMEIKVKTKTETNDARCRLAMR